MADSHHNIVHFYREGDLPHFVMPNRAAAEAWLKALAARHNAEILQLVYIFADDDYVLQINRDYLDHDYYTDIITFPYREGEQLESDIFISIDRVRDNAEQLGHSFEVELLRVMAHGVLHLLGYRDATDAQEAAMRSAEEEAITLYHQQSL